MRLAICTRAVFPQHGFGGLERAGTALVRHLLRRGVDIALFTRPLPVGKPFTTPPEWPVASVTAGYGRLSVHTVRYGRLPLRPNGIPARLTNYHSFVEELGLRVERMARKGYVQGVYAHGLCAWGVRRTAEWGVPMIANPHGMEDFKVRDPLKRLAYAPFRAWTRAGCQAADRVIATDYAIRQEASSLLGVDPRKVMVIPNGVDVDEIHALIDPAVQADLIKRWPLFGSDRARLKGISVGRLEANKGFEYLLRALSSAAPALGDSWTWIIVGDGSLRERLQSLASELGLGERVVFAGQVSDVELHNLYDLATLFAHPTLYEGSSLVTLEAMAHGLPVVASAVGGIPDKVLEGETGFLVAPGDWRGLGAKIAWITAHTESAREMGRRGRVLAQERFSWTQIAAQTEDLVLALIGEKSACKAAEAILSR